MVCWDYLLSYGFRCPGENEDALSSLTAASCPGANILTLFNLRDIWISC